MPGRTPAEAARAFLDPLKLALSCVAVAKISVSPGGRDVLERTHAWTINGGEGTQLRGGLHLEASMRYRIIHVDDPDLGPFRITTEGYLYALVAPDGREIFGIHWHPDGAGAVAYPHIHLARQSGLRTRFCPRIITCRPDE